MTQDYHNYTSTDHKVWETLYNRQITAVLKYAYAHFPNALKELEFSPTHIPDFNVVNKNLKELTGWEVFAVPGLMENDFFFTQLYQKRFGATVWIRKPEQIDYLEEPDLFHDVFGHVPLLSDASIGEYLSGLASIAVKNISNADVIEAIARLYWYTVEFGLIREKGRLKIYGAGILSSIAETEYSLGDKPGHLAYDVKKIIDTPYLKDDFQKQYFVIESLKQLPESLPVLERYLEERYITV